MGLRYILSKIKINGAIFSSYINMEVVATKYMINGNEYLSLEFISTLSAKIKLLWIIQKLKIKLPSEFMISRVCMYIYFDQR